MADFFLSAFPFLAIGLCLAVLCTAPQKQEGTYFSEGMCVGLAGRLRMRGLVLGQPGHGNRPRSWPVWASVF